MDAAVPQRGGDRRRPRKPVAEAELLDECHRAAVRTKEVVIELLEPQTRLDLEAGREPTGQWLALDDRDGVAALREAERDRQSERAGAQNRGASQAPTSDATSRP